MKLKKPTSIGTCPDCNEEGVELDACGICGHCKTRRQNAKTRGITYVPFKTLSEDKKEKIRALRRAQALRESEKQNAKEKIGTIPIPEIPQIENYYQVKAENNPAIAHVAPEPIIPNMSEVTRNEEIRNDDPLEHRKEFISTIKECGFEATDEDLQDVLDVLVSTDKLKDLLLTIAKSNSQQIILDLEQTLNVAERKLQHNWEYNGFKSEDDAKFKNFLVWRRLLKGAIFYWKKLYQTNTIIEMQRAWNAYTADPNDKILLAGDRADSTQKRYQISTDSISTIFNTRKPFTRVFYATSRDEAYKMFVGWMAERQLHEDKSKTTIVELKAEGKNGK